MVNTRRFYSRILRSRAIKSKLPKSIDSKQEIKISRVLDTPPKLSSLDFNQSVVVNNNTSVDNDEDHEDVTCCSSINDDDDDNDDDDEELGFQSSKDIVWAKAYPYTWWPGWIRRQYRGKFLISFFECEGKSLWFHESEICAFESEFKEMMVKIRRQRVQPGESVIDCALDEFNRRLKVEVEEDEKEEVLFQPRETLAFVYKMAVCAEFDEFESVGVIRAAAEVCAFRRFAFIKRDWIYDDTMRIDEVMEEVMGDLEANTKSTCSEEERTCLVAQEREILDEQEEPEEEEDDGEEEEPEEIEEEEDVEKEVVVEEEEEEDVEKVVVVVVEEEEEEEDVEKVVVVVVVEEEDEEDYTIKELMERVKSGSVNCQKKTKKSLEEHHLRETLQTNIKEVFQPVEALAFVRKMAVSPWVDDVDTAYVIRAATQVNTFRRHIFIKHDWIYRDTMRLSEHVDESEANMKSAFPEEQTCKMVQEVKLLDEEKENSHKLFVERVQSVSVICEKSIENPLHDILQHLYCLALDPFYSGSERHGVKNFDTTYQGFLRYREVVFQKSLKLSPPFKQTSYRDCVTETSKEQRSMSHLSDISVNVSENIGVLNDDRTQEPHNLSNVCSNYNKTVRVVRKTEGVNLCCRRSNGEDVEPVGNGEFESNKRQKVKDGKVSCSISNLDGRDVPQRDIPNSNGEFERNKRQKTEDTKVRCKSNADSGIFVDALRDTADYNYASESYKRQKTDNVKVYCSSNVEDGDVDHLRDTPICNSESESNKRQKVSTFDSVLHCQGGSTKIPCEDNSAYTNDDSHESKLSSHLIKPCDEAGIDGRTVDLKVGCRSKCLMGTLPGQTMSEKIIGAKRKDRVGVVTSQGPLVSHRTDNNVDLHPSAAAAAGLSSKKLSMGIVSGGSSEGKGKLDQHTIDVSVKFQQAKILQPLTMLYSSPLLAEGPASSGNAQFESSNPQSHPEFPTTLHMKFPKDFKLPSKDELVKQFRPFGPIDYLKTKIFFYTGSAQLVFLHHHDAEAACQFAKRKKIFLGGSNVRFWLNQHEFSRRGATNVSASLSLPTVGSSIPNPKPCLRISDPQGNKAERRHLHVKFPVVNQDLPSVTIETKHRVFTQSDSCKHSKEVHPDISPQMFVLLEKCNQIVTKIKDNVGLHSFYSLFTHNYCDTEFDDG